MDIYVDFFPRYPTANGLFLIRDCTVKGLLSVICPAVKGLSHRGFYCKMIVFC